MPLALVCSAVDPRIKCAGRHAAGLRAEFFFDFTARGWVWAVFKDDWRMKWDRCPYCKCPLPDMWAVYARLKDGIDDEED